MYLLRFELSILVERTATFLLPTMATYLWTPGAPSKRARLEKHLEQAGCIVVLEATYHKVLCR
jgi:hypothetical protein